VEPGRTPIPPYHRRPLSGGSANGIMQIISRWKHLFLVKMGLDALCLNAFRQKLETLLCPIEHAQQIPVWNRRGSWLGRAEPPAKSFNFALGVHQAIEMGKSILFAFGSSSRKLTPSRSSASSRRALGTADSANPTTTLSIANFFYAITVRGKHSLIRCYNCLLCDKGVIDRLLDH